MMTTFCPLGLSPIFCNSSTHLFWCLAGVISSTKRQNSRKSSLASLPRAEMDSILFVGTSTRVHHYGVCIFCSRLASCSSTDIGSCSRPCKRIVTLHTGLFLPLSIAAVVHTIGGVTLFTVFYLVVTDAVMLLVLALTHSVLLSLLAPEAPPRTSSTAQLLYSCRLYFSYHLV